MRVSAFKTKLVTAQDSLWAVLRESLPVIPENSIVVVASKLVSTCENRFVAKVTGDRDEKHALVKTEAELYLDPHSSKYDLMLTVKGNWLFVNAGIDESNANDHYLLWPENPQASANQIWDFLRAEYGLREVGVTISDSTSRPLNWGVTGHAIAHCGFNPLKSYIGKPDLFGRKMKMEQVNIMQSVTVAAVLEMGEGAEQTPLGLVEEVKEVEWQAHHPTTAELAALRIEIEDDAYAPLLTTAAWQKGGNGKK